MKKQMKRHKLAEFETLQVWRAWTILYAYGTDLGQGKGVPMKTTEWLED
jgi:hypothetical protein